MHLKGEDFKTDEEPKSDDVGLNRIYQTPSSHLSVVRCVPSQPTEKADWRKYATFHTFTKIENKNCKVVWPVEVVSMQYLSGHLKILD